MEAVRIHKEFVSPDGREWVELFGPRDGLYGFRLWQRKRKAWRRISDTRQWDSYVSLAYDAAEQIEWLRLTPSYHLEYLRGLAFEHAVYEAIRFESDHDHCENCPVKFMEYDYPNVQQAGYVARCPIPYGSGAWSWVWVCEKCFADLRAELQWQLE